MGPIATEIARRVTEALAPTTLEVLDESHHHAGHSGHDPRGESHLRVKITAAALTPLTRVARVRAVHHAVGDLLTGGRVHALSVEASGT